MLLLHSSDPRRPRRIEETHVTTIAAKDWLQVIDEIGPGLVKGADERDASDTFVAIIHTRS
jgi:hypothetical protein